MKKVVSFLLSLAFVLAVPFSAMASDGLALNIDRNDVSHGVSEDLYGITLSDIGLTADMVQNGSFESVTDYSCIGWDLSNTVSMSANNSVFSNNPNHAVVHTQNKAVIRNTGFDGAMHFEKGVTYELSLMVNNVDFDGIIGAFLDSKGNDGKIVQLTNGTAPIKQWTSLSARIKADETSDGSLALVFEGNGDIGIDMVSLVPTNSYGYDSDSWRYTSLRSDVVESIKALNPSFIRFVGGCTVESLDYSWKNTIGSLDSRLQFVDENENVKSCAMGYHEYFQLCEDLDATPVPTVGAGVMCQHNGDYEKYVDAHNRLNMSDEEFRAYLKNERGMDSGRINAYIGEIENLGVKSEKDFDKYIASSSIKPGTTEFTNYVQDVLDLIEYANGDSTTSYWGALRSLNGHEKPFGIKYLAIGSNNYGEVYERNFNAISKAVRDKYPDVVLVGSGDFSGAMRDEYFTITDDMLLENNTRFDSADRDSRGVIVGEYSSDRIGTMSSAVNEACFMTGVEANSDIVKMAGYYPALSFDESSLINLSTTDIVHTPNYFNQMIFANNVGTKFVDTSLASDDVYQSVTVDENAQVLYVKLVNSSSSSQSVRLSLSNFGDINKASAITLGNRFGDAFNSAKKQAVAPEVEDLDLDADGVKVTLGGNSVNVIRIAYGENDGTALWQIPDAINTDTKAYVPRSIKLLLVVFVPAFIVGSMIGFLVYTKLLKKRGNSKDV